MLPSKDGHFPQNPNDVLSEKMQKALASLALEGIILPSDALDDLSLFESNKITKAELLKRALNRAAR